MSNLYYVQQVGPNLVMLHPVGPHPDQGLPSGGARPDQGLPWQPGGGRPDQGLPWQPGRPDNSLPGGQPGAGTKPSPIPDNELPQQPPPMLAPGYTLVLVRQGGRWSYAAIAPSSPPPKPLPEPLPPDAGTKPIDPDNPYPDQGLPGAGSGARPPHISGQPTPPQPQPTPQRR